MAFKIETIEPKDNRGIVMAFAVILLWLMLLLFNFNYTISWSNPLTYVLFFIQIHLFTGLFITAHDAMHGTIYLKNKHINRWIGTVCLTLFAYNSYALLLPKHHQHHRFAASEQDPDYHPPGFWRWYLFFLKEYISLRQIVLMAITFNVLKSLFPTENIVFYYIAPAILSTLQLFYFGTYLPHKGEHTADNVHKAHSQPKNHLWAFVSCYFFGYHYEHHDSPQTPWWLLHTKKK